MSAHIGFLSAKRDLIHTHDPAGPASSFLTEGFRKTTFLLQRPSVTFWKEEATHQAN